MNKLTGISLVLLVTLSFSGCSKKPPVTNNTSNAPQLEATGEDPLSNNQSTRNDITDPVLEQIKNEQNSQGLSFYEANQDIQKKITIKIGLESIFALNTQKLFGKVRIVSARSIQVSNFTYAGTCKKIALTLTGTNDKKASIASLKVYNGEVSNDNFSYNLPASVSLLQFGRTTITCIDTNKVIASELFK